tara:strand:- start:1963 stop:2886 length:924 start_codon:yes stop_codon:yes gene_type:complete
MKIFTNDPKENWIVDRIRNEWLQNTGELATMDPNIADLIWIIAPWQWNNVRRELLEKKPVVCTIHHIAPEKLRKNEFMIRDKFVNAYHVPNKYTAAIVSELTNKPIYRISYWLNKTMWQPLDKQEAKKELEFPAEKYVVGSFQRDTEGSDLKTPKLEKGPDLLCDYLERINKTVNNLTVLLGGFRRNYVISRLRASNISFKYYEMASDDMIRRMYAACDLYIVSSRHEGGPQAVFEAAAMKTAIISNDVGCASNVLCRNCIIDIEKEIYFPTPEDIEANFKNVQKFHIQIQKLNYLNMFQEALKNYE